MSRTLGKIITQASWRAALAGAQRQSRATKLALFLQTFRPRPDWRVLDVGVSGASPSWRSLAADENFLAWRYPYPDRVVGVGVQGLAADARWPRNRPFVCGDGCALPFADGAFDLVFSNAVLEHVGSRARQRQFVAECLRVARRGIYLTTPDRAFPLETHTLWPLAHWLPNAVHRALWRRAGQAFWADEGTLNLLRARDLRRLFPPNCPVRIRRLPAILPRAHLVAIVDKAAWRRRTT